MEHEDAAAIFSGIRTFLYKEKTGMTEQFSVHPDNSDGLSELHNFKKGFNGMPDGVPADYAAECQALERKQQKAAASLSAAGLLLQCDENGAITIVQSGSHYIMIAANHAQEFRNAVNALIPAADPVVIDANTTPNLVPGAGGHMSQNERTALYLKSVKARRGY